MSTRRYHSPRRQVPDGGVPMEDIARWVELAPRYGMRIVGPPIPEDLPATIG